MAADIKEKIAKELADLRIRHRNEIPEIQVLDSEKTHARINALLDELDREGAAYAAAPGWRSLLGGAAG